MNFTPQQIGIDPALQVPRGHYVRLNALRRFMGIEERPSNGLGFLYRANGNGTYSRVHF